MRFRAWLPLVGVAGMVLPTFAQIEFRCRLVNSRVLLFESVPVEVVIENNTGSPLILGTEDANAFLSFDVESSPGVLVLSSGVPLLTNSMVIQHAKSERFTVDILRSYPIRETGPYSLTGRLEWSDKVFVTAKMYLDVVPGLEIAKLSTGVPGLPGSLRVYTLRTLNRDRVERAFLRIMDERDRCLGVLELGRIVRLYKPVLYVDEEGNLHVVHQNGPNSFVHHTVTPYGLVVDRDTFTADGTGLRVKAARLDAPLTAPEVSDDTVLGEVVPIEQVGKQPDAAR